jgi:potassium efflux system protein
MTTLSRALAALLVWITLAAGGGLAMAQPQQAQPQPQQAGAAAADAAAAPALPEVTVPALRKRLDQLPETIEGSEDVPRLVAETQDISAQAQRFVASREGPLADLNARLGELGAAPAAGATEDPDITRQRSVLEKERNALDADIRLARLIAVDAQQRSSDLIAQRRALFEARILERVESPLGEAFWRRIATAWPADKARLRNLANDIRTGLASAWNQGERGLLVASLVGALLLAVMGNWGAEHALIRLAARVFPMGRLRRSLLAIATVAATTLIAALAAQWVWQALRRGGDWSPLAQGLGDSLAQFAAFLGFVIGLGRALLANGRTSWRLPPMSDAIAARMAPFPWVVALVTTLIWMVTQVNTLVEASLAAVVATHAATALALAVLVAWMLLRLRMPAADPDAVQAVAGSGSGSGEPKATDKPARDHAAGDKDTADEEQEAVRPLWVGLVTGAVAVVLVAICVLVALGYVSLASFAASQLTWTGIVAAAAYLLFKFADDLFIALLSSRSASGQRVQKSFNLAPHTLDQAAVVLSAISRITLFFYLVIALLAPLGTSPDELFQRSGQLGSSLKVGQFELVPGALLGALGVLVIGFVVMRVARRWLDQSYLPTTTLEPGMRSSLITLLGYVGGALVIGSSLSALGIGIERIAWVASALSVGIGFGLQAIVQNFISGLILLAERPVKVGDWVVLGNAEGDVRRINVRATEIQLGDRSTLIVPNSEFITKTVRNMTLVNAEGRVLIRLPMPLTTDANRARDVLLKACTEHAGVLETPAASVTLDGIEGGFLIFQVIAYVQSPRLAGGVRSDLLFTMLDELRASDLPLAAYAAAPMPVPAAPSASAAMAPSSPASPLPPMTSAPA